MTNSDIGLIKFYFDNNIKLANYSNIKVYLSNDVNSEVDEFTYIQYLNQIPYGRFLSYQNDICRIIVPQLYDLFLNELKEYIKITKLNSVLDE